MEPEFAIAIAKDRTGRRPRPSILVRAVEGVGLAFLVLGLGGGRLWLAMLGGALVIASYAIFRQRHGAATTSRQVEDGVDNDSDGGGD